MIECISAITLATHDMRRAVRFYRELGSYAVSLAR
jgi:catechol 2,3-dioxygenase-like lactoylglutathione lyase family enzyme